MEMAEDPKFKKISGEMLTLILLSLASSGAAGIASHRTSANEIDTVRLEVERTFVHKDEFKEIGPILMEINQRLSRIEGGLDRDRRR